MTPQALDSLSREELVALVLAFSEQVRTLQARIAELEQQLKGPPKTPRNSSLPPSAGQKENRPERGRKVRKGRPGVARALAEHPDDVREVFAATCTGCGQSRSRRPISRNWPTPTTTSTCRRSGRSSRGSTCTA